MRDRVLLVVLLLLAYTTPSSPQNYELYPSTSLKCYSSKTKPDKSLICPLNRNSYCVKEVADLKQDLCGKTQYFDDEFIDSLCLNYKCADICTPGIKAFYYNGIEQTRTTYCCTTDYCNSSSRQFITSTLLTLASTCILCIVSIMYF